MNKKRLISFALLIITLCLILDFAVRFEDNGNSIKDVCFKILPIDYVYNRYYEEGNLACKGYRHKEKILLEYYDELGNKTSIIEGNHTEKIMRKTSFHKNGNVAFVAEIKDSIKHGYAEIFDIDGVFTNKILFKEGHRITLFDQFGNVEAYYPYITASKNIEKKWILFKLDFSHLDLREANNVEFLYDFAVDSTSYPTPRYVEPIDTSVVSMKFELDSTMNNFNQIYGFIRIDSLDHYAFKKGISELIELNSSM